MDQRRTRYAGGVASCTCGCSDDRSEGSRTSEPSTHRETGSLQHEEEEKRLCSGTGRTARCARVQAGSVGKKFCFFVFFFFFFLEVVGWRM